ncbi:MAG: hypothetical protein NZ700_08190 [Gemmataceae bacterium]|nr:hypothetical protein [Gemmataceae bacterium]MDW8264385.1 hypothetical protein [Gemmataceae bacterium]
MWRWAILLVALLGGCSTAPVANFLDFVRPGRLRPGPGLPYGGVGIPHPPSTMTPQPIVVPSAPPRAE